MNKKKSVLEDALLEVEQLKEAVKENAKGILQSTMKEELNDLLKEDVNEEDVTESDGALKDLKNPKEQLPESEGFEGGLSDLKNPKQTEPGKGTEKNGNEHEGGLSDLKGPKKEEPGKGSEKNGKDHEGGMNDLKNPKKQLPEQEEDVPDEDEFDNELEGGDEVEPIDDENPLENEPDDDADDVETEDTFDDEDEDDVLDMTGASDEEVLKVFKAMKPEDGVIVKKDDDDLKVNFDDEEFIIKLDSDDEEEEEEGGEEEEGDELDMGDEMATGDEEGEEEDELMEQEETVYEIELDDDDFTIKEPTEEISEEKEEEGSEEDEEEDEKEEEMDEASRTMGNDVRTRIPRQGKKFKAGRSNQPQLQEEYKKLKKQNAEYKKALIKFKDQLLEVALFNSNLAYSTRLFTEHSTTKKEKLDILKRFDSVKTKKDSDNLFEQINKELSNKKTIAENAVEKITSTPQSSSKEVLSEQTAYENPQIKRMKELMKKVK